MSATASTTSPTIAVTVPYCRGHRPLLPRQSICCHCSTPIYHMLAHRQRSGNLGTCGLQPRKCSRCFPLTIDKSWSHPSSLSHLHCQRCTSAAHLLSTHSFSLPASYGVPPLSVASITHLRRLIHLLLHLHSEAPASSASPCPWRFREPPVETDPALPAYSVGDGGVLSPHEAVFPMLHHCRISLDEQRHFHGRIPNLLLLHLLLLWLPADLPRLTICMLALSASTPSLFQQQFQSYATKLLTSLRLSTLHLDPFHRS
ncbi:hypothetical protein B296_00038591 [Ensete ventricosum]|uniref:Uncharacterized protein n=1 Tax=Ensete ventricosum TaxID=4639 RepID=A0A426XWK9_ENSVE|nr:hypothetical protein B296_00038591 [Ensete ventricosum]